MSLEEATPSRDRAAREALGYRLRASAWMVTLSFAAAFPVLNWAPPSERNLTLANAVAGSAIGVCLLVIAITRKSQLSYASLLNLGLAYEVLIGLGICVAEAFASYDIYSVVRGVSWVCLWIVAFPIIVPAGQKRALFAGLLTATMGLVAIGMVNLSGAEPAAALTVVYWVLPNYLSVGLAILIRNRFADLERDVAKARALGVYQMISRIGEGGMGEVWKARHRMLKRPVAIKLIRSKRRDKEAIAKLRTRFEREAQATASLSSPHTVTVFDFGVSADGTLYYVMELLEGIDLQTLVSEHGRLPPERAVELMMQACRSLGEAHTANFVHRDIKPANLFLTVREDRLDHLKVLDFGLVQLASGDDESDDANNTPGTPATMAPELIRSGAEATAQSDVYALGVVLYWLLIGDFPFQGESSVEMLNAHLRKQASNPSELREEISEPLGALVLACLEKDPKARPRGAEGLGHRLRELPEFGAWSESKASLWWSKNPSLKPREGTFAPTTNLSEPRLSLVPTPEDT